MASNISIRFATDADSEIILDFIRALADYEKLSHEVTATSDDIRASMFGERAFAECLLAFDRDEASGQRNRWGLRFSITAIRLF